MTNLWTDKVTIYNDIPATSVEPRKFNRFVISNCQIQGGYVNRANGTIQNIVNAKTVITKDILHYKSIVDYSLLPADEKENYFTAKTGDFVVFGEVDDIITTAAEFSAMQQKYKDNGIKVMSVAENINGMSVDNVTMSNI